MDERASSSVVVGLVAASSPDYVAKTFAHWRQGHVVVPLRSTDDGYRTQIARVTEVETCAPGSGWLDARFDSRRDDTPAQILFTSGTEGEPKGVVLTHANLADVVDRLNAVMKVTSEIREYVGVPVTHSFGFARCRAVLAAGGRAFLPPRGFNPLEIAAMLEAGEINAISAVPSLWRVLLGAHVISDAAARRVRWIEIGSQFMSASEKEALRALFSRAIIVQHYGLTEASRTTFLEIHAAPSSALESVGRTVGQSQVRVLDDGRIAIRGPHVTSRMLRRDGAFDPRDSDGWIVTHDLGELKDGFLFFRGRADDVINCGGIKLAPDAIEDGVRQALGVTGELAVCRIPDPIRGDGILVAATPSVAATDAALLDAAVEVATALGVNARGALSVLRVDDLPRTENGKVKRNELSARFVERSRAQAASTPASPSPSAERASDLRAQLAAILGVAAVADSDSFVSLGGDSLRFIQASVVLERQLGYLPAQWERQSVGELERLPRKASSSSQLEPSVLLRAIAIVAIVMNHAGVFASLFPIDGAALMLLLPSGYSFARFQLQRVIASGRARMALSALPRVIAPAIFLLALQQLRHRDFELAPLLLVHNFVNAPGVLSFWYIEVFVQIHVIMALLLTLRPLRNALRDHAWPTSVLAVIAAAALAFASPLVWSTSHLHNLVPQHLLWNFMLGWCLLFARPGWQRWVNGALVIGLAATRLPELSSVLWILAGGLFLNAAPTLQLPAVLTRMLNALASASLYIYTSHFLLLEPVARVLPRLGPFGPVVVALCVGVAFWLGFEGVWRFVARRVLRVARRPA